MKKTIFILFLMSFAPSLFAQDAKEHITLDSENTTKHLLWEADFDKAKKRSKKEKKLLLVFFTGSDWCGPCKKLEADFFETLEFIDLANNNLILYEADFPRRTDIVSPEKKIANKKLQTKYKIGGYPTVVVLNSKGAEVGRRKGYTFTRDPKHHFTLIKDLIKAYR